ncbi:response regulator [Paracoccus caeni]|nr:response regulator [Paracoccus caeni]
MMDILMIEDQGRPAARASAALAGAGWHVALHGDGYGGIDAIRKIRPRMVILNKALPNRSGIEILAELRADENASLALTPVLVLVGSPEEGAGVTQADAILAKPLAERDLQAAVRRMLR